MRKLIIEQMGLEQYEHLEYVMEFYPNGLKGLVTDYLAHYLDDPGGALEELPRDARFFGQVLDIYDDSSAKEVHVSGEKYPGAAMMILVVKVADVVRDIVQQYGSMLRDGVFDPSLVDWGRGYLLVPTRS